jgi:hypothetical protein
MNAWSRPSRSLPQAFLLFGNNSKENDLHGNQFLLAPRRLTPGLAAKMVFSGSHARLGCVKQDRNRYHK